MRNLLEKIFTNGGVIAFLFVLSSSLLFISLYQNSKQQKQIDKFVNVPNIEQNIPEIPKFTGIGGKEIKEEFIITTTSTYTPEFNEWEKDNFLNAMENVAIKGEFQDVDLILEAEAPNESLHFLSITVDYTSGVYGVSRNKCNFKENCAFTKKSPLQNLRINLKDKVLLSGNNYVLWDEIQPPVSKNNTTIAKMLFLPFNEQGIPNGTITSAKIEYSCVEKGGCKIKKCDEQLFQSYSPVDIETACAVWAFGEEHAKNYQK